MAGDSRPVPAPPVLRALTRPGRLRSGDRVAVVAPSGPLVAERLDRGVAILQSWGLDVEVGKHVLEVRRHLAGTDEQRAHDLQSAWCEPEIRAVFAARGGSGAARIVDLLDWEAMRSAGPRLLVGFSDVTVLHQAVANRLGLATLFGPMVASEVFGGDPPDSESVDRLRTMLFEPERAMVIADRGLKTEVPGRASGILVGGTLALLANTVGTPEHRPGAGGLVVLEDIAEPSYRVDSMLTQLLRTGWFAGAAGIVLGSWTGCGPDAVEVVAERLRPLGVPMVSGLPVGHGTPQLTLPLGVNAELDADAGRLLLPEPALR